MSKHSKLDKETVIIVLVGLLIGAIIIVAVLFYADRKVRNQSTDTSSEQTIFQKKELTAEDIANELKEKTENVGNIVVYDEISDLNKLLGRPNQYVSKATFEDKRLEQVNKDNEFLTEEERNEPIGGTIEVFNNEEDMQSRKNYIEQISTSASIFAQYIYSKGNALLRLESDLTPEQAKVYETAFYEIVK